MDSGREWNETLETFKKLQAIHFPTIHTQALLKPSSSFSQAFSEFYTLKSIPIHSIFLSPRFHSNWKRTILVSFCEGKFLIPLPWPLPLWLGDFIIFLISFCAVSQCNRCHPSTGDLVLSSYSLSILIFDYWSKRSAWIMYVEYRIWVHWQWISSLCAISNFLLSMFLLVLFAKNGMRYLNIYRSKGL